MPIAQSSICWICGRRIHCDTREHRGQMHFSRISGNKCGGDACTRLEFHFIDQIFTYSLCLCVYGSSLITRYNHFDLSSLFTSYDAFTHTCSRYFFFFFVLCSSVLCVRFLGAAGDDINQNIYIVFNLYDVDSLFLCQLYTDRQHELLE